MFFANQGTKKYHYIIPLILQKIGYVISWIILNIFVHLEIHGVENLRNIDKPIILASNHTSELDPAIFALVLPLFSKHFPIYFVSYPKGKYDQFGLRSYLYGGVFFNMLGAYPIAYGKKDYKLALENHINLLRLGRTVCIFPEGKITKDGNLSLGHGGVAYLSYTTKASVVPIAINTFYNLSWKIFLLGKRRVVVNIGVLIKTEDIIPEKEPSIDDFRRGGQRVVDAISRLIF